ncbi:MAG: OadG family protein [bacterium]
MISESINFMILGMSTVFSFLLIMILVLKIQSFLIGKISFDDSSVDTSDLSSKSNRGVDQKKVAVISAAIKQHESDKK